MMYQYWCINCNKCATPRDLLEEELAGEGAVGYRNSLYFLLTFSVDLILQQSIKFYRFKSKPRDQLPIQAGFEESKWTAKAGRGQGQSRMKRLTSRRPSLWLFGTLPLLFLHEESLCSSVTMTQSSLAALRVLKVLTFLLQLAKLLDSSSRPEKATTATKSLTCLWQRPSM